MKDAPTKKLLRCAIYTRKSTDHNLELEFNSLHAQREACEAYIKSQAPEGWRLIATRYDDGAVSGASLDRPALQKLLAEVQAGRIDVVVVYKVDRLTRSLADFAKLVELFDRHAVSFVSVTQHFNTTTSMGRLTLNVLLSFAQFEREVIGERVRDKIAASKRKGLWVGGPVPLGYASANKKIVIVPEEARTVRRIFRRYLELGSVGALMQDLDRRGIRTKRQSISNGRIRGGIRFGLGALAHLLRNRFYVGEVVYRGKVHRGGHEPIVDRVLFEAVQAKLDAGATERRMQLRASPAILTGRVFDDRGNRMTPTHTNKRGVRYRYYVSHAVLQKRREAAGGIVRIPAPDIEGIVVKAIRDHLGHFNQGERPAQTDDRDLVDRYLDRVVVRSQAIEVGLHADVAADGRRQDLDEFEGSSAEARPAAIFTIPWRAPSATAAKGILHAAPSEQGISPETRDVLLDAIAKARRWIDDLTEGRAASFAEIAKREGKVERHIRFLASLAFVSPRCVSAIIEGSVPSGLTVSELARSLPVSWSEQERQLGLRRS